MPGSKLRRPLSSGSEINTTVDGLGKPRHVSPEGLPMDCGFFQPLLLSVHFSSSPPHSWSLRGGALSTFGSEVFLSLYFSVFRIRVLELEKAWESEADSLILRFHRDGGDGWGLGGLQEKACLTRS